MQQKKNIKIRSQLIKKNLFFGSVPKSPTQMDSLSAKNASEKFSCLGIFQSAVVDFAGV